MEEKQGNLEDQLWNLYPVLRRYAVGLWVQYGSISLIDALDVDDLVQETILRLYQQVGDHPWRVKLPTAYARKVMKHTFWHAVRQQGVKDLAETQMDVSAWQLQQVQDGTDLERDLLTKERVTEALEVLLPILSADGQRMIRNLTEEPVSGSANRPQPASESADGALVEVWRTARSRAKSEEERNRKRERRFEQRTGLCDALEERAEKLGPGYQAVLDYWRRGMTSQESAQALQYADGTVRCYLWRLRQRDSPKRERRGKPRKKVTWTAEQLASVREPARQVLELYYGEEDLECSAIAVQCGMAVEEVKRFVRQGLRDLQRATRAVPVRRGRPRGGLSVSQQRYLERLGDGGQVAEGLAAYERVLKAYHIQGKSIQTIVEEKGLAPGTVKSLLARGRDVLNRRASVSNASWQEKDMGSEVI